jgi:hypothetical protein
VQFSAWVLVLASVLGFVRKKSEIPRSRYETLQSGAGTGDGGGARLLLAQVTQFK